MAKKKTTRKTKSAGKTGAAVVRESAEKIWLAGLGALALAEEEGGKFFRALVNKGEEYRERDGESPVEQVRNRAAQTVADVEAAIDRQIADALQRVGVPSRGEIARLVSRVDQLTRVVEGRGKSDRKPAKKAVRKAPKKATRKTTPASRSKSRRATA